MRDGVPDAIEKLKKAGIRTIMVTGDNIVTAIAISKDAGIISREIKKEDIPKYAVESKDLRNLTEDELDTLLLTLSCVARCQPKDKLRVVQRL